MYVWLKESDNLQARGNLSYGHKAIHNGMGKIVQGCDLIYLLCRGFDIWQTQVILWRDCLHKYGMSSPMSLAMCVIHSCSSNNIIGSAVLFTDFVHFYYRVLSGISTLRKK